MATDTNHILKASAIRDLLTIKRHPLDTSKVRSSAPISDKAGLKNLGIHFCVLEPQQQSTVIHYHEVEEEWLYILSGNGTLIIHDGEKLEEKPVGAGDFIACPAGENAYKTAHALQAQDEAVEYLCGGSRAPVDICRYPLEGKALIINAKERTWVLSKNLSKTPLLKEE